MGGGLMQLVAYGAQDIYLTGNPQITFFKVVYRRHTNFSMEAIAQTFSGTGKPDQTATATISRNGDLIHKMYLVCDSPTGVATGSIGSAIIKTAELEIGGQKIDKHWSTWNQIWNELSTPESKAIGLKSMQGDIGRAGTAGSGAGTIQVPLNFWFCRNPGLALPLIALQYHEVKVQFVFGSAAEAGLDPTNTFLLFVDYIYLDTDERRRFAQVSHEYLIEQIQKQDIVAQKTQKLVFNHPVKELIWCPTGSGDAYSKAQLKLNGHDRFSEQKPEYFQLRQPFDYHTAVPRQNLPTAAQLTSNFVKFSEDSIQTPIVSEDAPDGDALGTSACSVGAIADGEVGGGSETLNDGAIGEVGGVAGAIDQQALVLLKATARDVGTNKCGFVVGRLYELTLSGSAAVTTQPFLVRVTFMKEGANTNDDSDGKAIDAANTVVSFDRLITKSEIGDTGGAGVFQITSVREATTDALLPSEARTSQMTDKISVYSFALKPEEHQPSGTCNFSRIDTAILELTSNKQTGEIYAVNYNVLRIMSGMGGLAYSN